MLKNSSIATLEMRSHRKIVIICLENNQPRWWIKDAILTERAFYLFQEKGDLLGDEYGKNEKTSNFLHWIVASKLLDKLEMT